jgi:hypothetical protein
LDASVAFSFTAASWIGLRLAVLIIKYCVPSDAVCLCFGLESGAVLVIDSLSGPVTQNKINSFKAFMCENALAKSPTMVIMGSNEVLTTLVPGANSNSWKNLAFEVGTNQ